MNWRLARRAAFFVYAFALFVATHWPRLTIPMEGRPDLRIHAGVFAGWTGLLIACGFFGPPLSGRNIVLCIPVAVAYAAVDEWIQAIPGLHRTAALDDWAADVVGVAVGALLAALVAATLRRATPA